MHRSVRRRGGPVGEELADGSRAARIGTDAQAACREAWGTGCAVGREYRYPLLPELLHQPVGVAHRIAPLNEPDPRNEPPVDEARRTFLKYALVAGVVAAGAAGGATALHYLAPLPPSLGSYPKVQLVFADGSPVLASQYPYGSSNIDLLVFNYPLANEPNLLLDLGGPAPNGVGPSQGLVAYSAICQHQGCLPPYISYYPAGACGSYYGGKAIIHCICHGSTYDPALAAASGGAALVSGPAEVPLPQVLLSWDSATDYLYAIGAVGPPVYGHTNTLSGGSAAASPTPLSAPQTPPQQCPT
jgi:Rieske Fe-S protein